MLNDAPDIAFESLQATGTITRVDVDPWERQTCSSLLFPINLPAICGFFHLLLPEIENDLAEQRKRGSWCAPDYGRGYRLDEQQLHNGPFGTHAALPLMQSRPVFCLVEQLHAKARKKCARSLDLDPNESEAQSSRCGCPSVMNYRFGCRFPALVSHRVQIQVLLKLPHDALDET